MDKIEKIRQEIERLKGYISVTHFAEELLSFLDTLEESERPEPYNPVYDEAYLNEKIKKATESWKGVDVDAMLAECRGYDEEKSEEPDKSLEEAAIDFADNARKQLFTKDYAISSIADYDHGCIDGFKAGAKWHKEQMLKEAVEGKIVYDEQMDMLQPWCFVGSPFHVGDKVKVIVIKEDEK